MSGNNRFKKIYMDGAATMPTDPEVIESMFACLNDKESYANSSSVHVSGRDAMQKIEKARDQISKLINANKEEPQDIYINMCWPQDAKHRCPAGLRNNCIRFASMAKRQA